MKNIDFINKFDINHPDWSGLPTGFPKLDLTGLTSEEIGKFNAIKTLWEFSQPQKSKQESRVRKDPKGYQYLGVWQNAALLRELVRKFTLTLPLPGNIHKPPFEFRLKAQMDDSARSVKRNIEEGWKRPTTKEYLDFLGYSQASLEELKGDLHDCRTDGFLKSIPGSSMMDQGFDLRVGKGPHLGQVKGEPTDQAHPYCRPLITLDPHTLTYEMFMELVNKTEWMLGKLVQSLEIKMDQDGKGYRIAQSKYRIKW